MERAEGDQEMNAGFRIRAGAMALAAVLATPVVRAQTVDVVPVPETVAPDGKRVQGEAFAARPGDLLFSGRILRTEAAIVEGSEHVEVDRFSDVINPGDELTAVLVPPKIASRLGVDQFYCGRDQRSRSKFGELMLGHMFSKFRSIVRFCFIDSDGDRKFDKFLLAGAKDKALQAPRAITPLPYRIDRMRQMNEGDQIRVRYRKFVPVANKVELEVETFRAGKKEVFDYILWSTPVAAQLEKLYPRMTANPKKTPYPVYFNDILGAVIKVGGVSATGEASFSLERDLALTLFKPVSIQVNYIFIYY
jgi:hypothetical protein